MSTGSAVVVDADAVVVTVAKRVVELTFAFVFGHDQSHGSDRASHRSVCTPCCGIMSINHRETTTTVFG